MTAVDNVVGVIGGMGPHATIDFMARVLARTPATRDQDHVHMLVENYPGIPSRQAAMRNQGEDPGAAIAAVAGRLERAGADFLVMPCNLAHAWQDEILEATSVPFVSIVDESVRAAMSAVPGGPIGLFTTPGCFSAGLYQRALGEIPVVLQTPDELADTMTLVDRIKAGEQSGAVAEGLRSLADRLVTRGASALIAACTEFPLVLHESMFAVPFISSTDALADRTVAIASLSEPLPER